MSEVVSIVCHLYVKPEGAYQMQRQPCSEYINNLNIIREIYPLNMLHLRATRGEYSHHVRTSNRHPHIYYTAYTKRGLLSTSKRYFCLESEMSDDGLLPLTSVERNLCCCYFRPPEGIVQTRRFLRLFRLLLL